MAMEKHSSYDGLKNRQKTICSLSLTHSKNFYVRKRENVRCLTLKDRSLLCFIIFCSFQSFYSTCITFVIKKFNVG